MFEQLFWEPPGFQIFSLLSPEISEETFEFNSFYSWIQSKISQMEKAAFGKERPTGLWASLTQISNFCVVCRSVQAQWPKQNNLIWRHPAWVRFCFTTTKQKSEASFLTFDQTFWFTVCIPNILLGLLSFSSSFADRLVELTQRTSLASYIRQNI